MDNEYTEAALTSEWFVVVDDVVGGWCITTVNKPMSEIDFRDGSVLQIGDIVSKDVADYIVYLHERERLS